MLSVSRNLQVGVGVLYLSIFFYILFVQQQILLAVLSGVVVVLGYLVWRLGRILLLLEAFLEERTET